jgi:hypothetical protein
MTFAMAGRLALRVRPVEGAPAQRAGIGIVEVGQFDTAGKIGRSLQALVANG